MGKREKLLAEARTSSANLPFDRLVTLAEFAGFKKMRQKGSHIYFKHPNITVYSDAGLSLQEGKDGKSKKYQVMQLLDRIDTYDLMPDEES